MHDPLNDELWEHDLDPDAEHDDEQHNPLLAD